jgi:GH43 family beta-xylosidase
MRKLVTTVSMLAAMATMLALAGPDLATAATRTNATATRTNATYFNNAAMPAADPYVLYDRASGYYYAYSTEGADPGYYFAVYRSADLVTWEKAAPGALPVSDPKQWGNDWFWAPEVYHNSRTGLYYMFYAARSDANAKSWFGYANFEEPCKIGVAVSRSPVGPFHNIANHPIDYNPYDPNYHDVNLIMGPDQLKPPATLAQGETAPLGTYIPAIDPDVYFGHDGRQYLYYSRNAYRNWVWDTDLGKYIEESNILAVQLTTRWWRDPTGRTMPTIAPAYRNANAAPGGPSGPRRDGFVRILDYDHQKQAWENADVNDYARSGGKMKDRRWEEGSTTFERGGVYYLTYSANNWQTPAYGVGYAVSKSPLGPFRKYAGNPILSQNASIGMYSTGHGSLAFSPDGTEAYYVHHGRPTPTEPQRRLYTDRMYFGRGGSDAFGYPILSIDQATSDRPIPSGVAPYSINASRERLRLRRGATATMSWKVKSANGASLALANPLNRVRAFSSNPNVAGINASATGATVVGVHRGRTTIILTYQRELSSGGYRNVYNIIRGHRRLVAKRIRVVVTGRRR